jgi:hypothetical protein
MMRTSGLHQLVFLKQERTGMCLLIVAVMLDLLVVPPAMVNHTDIVQIYLALDL